mmetsp:Transcript_574/g.520  ORF Transcript_574/g.520 Transcript_574/m.520 type:complete len:87 (-) Transcript_574:1937-2197(-)
MGYICKTNKKSGKVLKEKIADIPKKYLKQILESDEVEIEGKKYYSKDYREEDIPPQVFIVLDCPKVEYLDSLLQNEQIKSLQGDQI